MKKLLPIAIVLLFIICLSTITVLISRRSETENTEAYDGVVECDETDVASKIPGRIASVLVEEGQLVKKGQLLAIVETREIDQKLIQARSAQSAIGAQEEKALLGAD
ncbi:MAG: biotin/lipoyl-binding protein, partial [Abditibacteriota bacterium]|nr:biotin/lipoyl-binding protein [Abditibacteriota bacterium]